MIKITGLTKVFGILADPVAHVKTPQRLNEFFTKIKYDGVLVPMHVHPESLMDLVNGLKKMPNLGGVVVTVPHKTAMVELCDEVSPTARRVEAVNVVRREHDGKLVGDILDGKGFVEGMHAEGYKLKNKRTYIAGAGGAASAIAFALVEAGVSQLTIANRTIRKAESLKERIMELHPEAQITIGTVNPDGHDVIVNGTSLGLNENDVYPVDIESLNSSQLVCEVIMQPKETPLIIAAKRRGCKVQYGAPMLVNQVKLMASFLGVNVP